MTAYQAAFAAEPGAARRRPRLAAGLLALLAAPAFCACGGPQSALAAAGVEAQRIAALFWVMAIAAVAIWLVMLMLMLWAGRVQLAPAVREKRVRQLIAAGIAWPLLTLTPLLGWGLSSLSGLRPAAAELRVTVVAERWWWRIAYEPRGRNVVTANELYLPADQAVALTLSSRDVIHSFWVPSLAGKMDMLPGRDTELVLRPVRVGRYRGVCAEYCGSAHAQMAFVVRVVERPEFERWLEHQAAAAVAPAAPLAQQGAQAFERNGCGGCHSVRGSAAAGRIGPDLTHVGSRLSLAAGELPNDAAALERWLMQPQAIKPGALMPSYHHLQDAERSAIAAYLGALR